MPWGEDYEEVIQYGYRCRVNYSQSSCLYKMMIVIYKEYRRHFSDVKKAVRKCTTKYL